MNVRPPKRPFPTLTVAVDLALLLVLLAILAALISKIGTPKPHSTPLSVATVSPSSKPTLRPPSIITTPPPTPAPFIGEGTGKG